MRHDKWMCPKCGHREFDVEQMRAAGGAWAAIFDVSNKRFTSVICQNCTYTELYRTPLSDAQKVFDFLLSG